MKIAILGSAPSSVGKAPFGDPSWQIWACSPGAYPNLARIDEFWEIHRWEPGVVGRPGTQKPWFTPEYVQWLGTVPPVLWLADPDALAANPRNGRELPWRDLVSRYGHYVWTSTIAYMLAMAIDRIKAARAARAPGDPERDAIGLWGVDMAANEELYSGQRWACQFFLQVIVGLRIEFFIPPESDLAVPPPMYGVSEINHRAIKFMERKRELEARLAQVDAALEATKANRHFLAGAIDDMTYHQTMWLHEGDSLSFDFSAVFPGADPTPSTPVAPVSAGAVLSADDAARQADPVVVEPPSTPIATSPT